MAEQFVNWTNKVLQKNGWSQAELARRAGLSKATISDISSGKIKPGYEVCIRLAKALLLPPQEVLRLAGLLPKIDLDQEEYEKLVFVYDNLSRTK